MQALALALAWMVIVVIIVLYVALRIFIGDAQGKPIPPADPTTEEQLEEHTIGGTVFTKDKSFSERMRAWLS